MFQPGWEGLLTADQRKFSQPHFHAYQIDRSRLIDLVTGAANTPLTFLQAPAGYGKSTLLRQTANRITASGAKMIWLNCDSRDRDPEILTAGLHQALSYCDTFFKGQSSLGSTTERLEQ
jgi:ATP/maltotriose-dependent transcriptional regulator MalT